MRTPPPQTRRGFTLVEMMIVIVIIGLLAALISVAASAAIGAARRASILTELTQLDMAMKQYNTDRGAYPPCMGSTNRTNQFVAHMRRAFPRYSVTNYNDLKTALTTAYNNAAPGGPVPSLDTLDQAEALVFWLGGPPTPRNASGQTQGTTKLAGFSASPSDPFSFSTARLPTPFEFDERRLVDYDNDGWFEYIPPGNFANTVMPPYVYFDAGSYSPATSPTAVSYPYSGTGAGFKTPNHISDWGTVVPYLNDTTAAASMAMVNPKSFQIVSAGLDAVYSQEGMKHYGGDDAASNNWTAGWPVNHPDASSYLHWPNFTTGANFGQSEGDNLANFYTQGEIQDIQQ